MLYVLSQLTRWSYPCNKEEALICSLLECGLTRFATHSYLVMPNLETFEITGKKPDLLI